MKWQYLNKIVGLNDLYQPLRSHASNPTPIHLYNGVHRIFFSSRDVKNQAYISYVDIDFESEFRIINRAKKPLIQLGTRGAFDESGMSIGSIVETDQHYRLYYMGWNIARSVPFRNSIGLLLYNKKTAVCERYSIGPLLDRSINDPFSISYPFVLFDQNKWKMWYGSHRTWSSELNDMEHGLKYAESENGINWRTNSEYCIAPDPENYAFSRPFVIKEKDIFKMWYCYRGLTYRLGYAESVDGQKWTRLDNIHSVWSKNNWDNQMICYPSVIDYNNNRYLLYNGNDYGKTGIGLAILK